MIPFKVKVQAKNKHTFLIHELRKLLNTLRYKTILVKLSFSYFREASSHSTLQKKELNKNK